MLFVGCDTVVGADVCYDRRNQNCFLIGSLMLVTVCAKCTARMDGCMNFSRKFLLVWTDLTLKHSKQLTTIPTLELGSGILAVTRYHSIHRPLGRAQDYHIYCTVYD